MKPLRSIGSLCVAVPLSICTLGQSSTTTLSGDVQVRPGLVVEKIEENGQAQRIGMHRGDILLAWKRGADGGEFESPFDMAYVFLEEASRGPVTVVGLKGGERREWRFGSDTWGFSTHPNLAAQLLSIYEEGESLLMAGKPIQAAERFREAAAAAHNGTVAWLGPWFLSHASRSLADARQWEQSDAVHQEAIAGSAQAGPIVRAELFRQQAARFESRQDLVGASEAYSRVLQESRKIAPRTMIEANCLLYLAIVELRQGAYDRAEERLHQATAIGESLAPSSIQSVLAMANLAVLYQDQGEIEKAEAYYLKALQKEEEYFPNSPHLEGTLSDLGVLFDQQGDLGRAEAYHRRALSVAERLNPESLDVADILGNLAECLIERGHPAQGEVFEKRALAIREHADPGGLCSVDSLAGLGKIARIRGELTQAEEYYRRSLAIAEKANARGWQRVSFLIGLAAVFRDRNDMPSAEHMYRQAVEIIEKEDPDSVDRASTLADLAGTVFRQNRLDEAEQLYQHAITTFESRTLHLGGILETRSRYRAENIRYYKEYIDLLVEQGRPERAFELLEGFRARTLFEMLAQSHVDITSDADPGTLTLEAKLRHQLNARSAYRMRSAALGQSDQQLRAIDREMEGLLLQYQQVEAQLRNNNPHYAVLTQPPKLSLSEIQNLLDANTLLLEYSLGEQRSYVWAVGHSSARLSILPRRSEIEAAAQKVYDLLTWRNRTPTVTPKDEEVTEKKYMQAATRLSRMLLGPTTDLIPGKRLLIVSDGALQYIPFSALPTPIYSNDAVPLIVKHEIVSLPSASVLAELRRQQLGRPKATRMVAVLADPVFDPKDERAKPAIGTPFSPAPSSAKHRRELTRSANDVGLTRNGRLYLNRLLYTRNEAEAVMANIPRGKGMLALDFAASRATATSPELAKYRIVHFATHGILNNKHPELSGLVLSLVDRQGNAQNGFLSLQDIYNLKLPVDLVVLSGCETGLGENIHGEGLISLTRGFMYAGASRVVATLWSVSDLTTAILMTDFYKAIKHDGKRPAAALRRAQIQMWQQKQWSSPYYWAAFQIQGEWQ